MAKRKWRNNKFEKKKKRSEITKVRKNTVMKRRRGDWAIESYSKRERGKREKMKD